jgi:monofunctional biosynthetic peptidoglycan transglycosylase
LEFARGASTITQQLAKNLYLSPSKNPLRKLKELALTFSLERNLSKRRILEIYLNVIEWGNGVYGAEAAARTYYGKSCAELSDDEAAALAAVIINPRRYSPTDPNKRIRKRIATIKARMEKYHYYKS